MFNFNFHIKDTCFGHVLAETCIMRYPKSSSNGSYIYVIHPMPNDFIKMTGNLDITSTKDKKLRSIESFDYEILPSGVVIKLIDYPFEEIYYQVI